MTLLAEKKRPTLNSIDSLMGAAGKLWKNELLQWRKESKFHLILWGSPGVGKTTLAKLLGEYAGGSTIILSAVNEGVKEIRKAVAESPINSVVVIDEIHRLSRSQQDVLLPILENSHVWIIGTTTENPRTALIPPILSRIRLIKVNPPSTAEIEKALLTNLGSLAQEYPNKCSQEKLERITSLIKTKIANMAHGDLRFALNFLEALFHSQTEEEEKELFNNSLTAFAKNEHYNYISAMIKSMRGSDPDAALYYATKALDSGEDLLFILRRCVIFASEDIGNADPQALILAQSALNACQVIGIPEGAIIMAQCITYLSSTVKSNCSYMALDNVRSWIRDEQSLPGTERDIPIYLTKAGANQYKYPHSYENSFVDVNYLPKGIKKFRQERGPAYQPSKSGTESKIKSRLAQLWSYIWNEK